MKELRSLNIFLITHRLQFNLDGRECAGGDCIRQKWRGLPWTWRRGQPQQLSRSLSWGLWEGLSIWGWCMVCVLEAGQNPQNGASAEAGTKLCPLPVSPGFLFTVKGGCLSQGVCWSSLACLQLCWLFPKVFLLWRTERFVYLGHWSACNFHSKALTWNPSFNPSLRLSLHYPPRSE